MWNCDRHFFGYSSVLTLAPCPSGGLNYQNETCFLLSDHYGLPWDAARSECEGAGAALAKVDSDGRQRFLETALASGGAGGEYWIGGKEARSWMWQHSRSP